MKIKENVKNQDETGHGKDIIMETNDGEKYRNYWTVRKKVIGEEI